MTRYSTRYRRKWLYKRIRRKGLLRTIDEVLFQFYYRLFSHDTNQRLLLRSFEQHFGPEAFKRMPGVQYYDFLDLNSFNAVTKLEELKPDLVFAVCITQYLKKPYLQIPRCGTVLYHEGLTPEYRGLHTAFWANYNGEPDRIGYTLLRLNEHVDGGQPIAQGVGKVDPELAHWWGYAGHQALIDGLPDVEKALSAVESGHPIQVSREAGPPGMYSYAGLSDELRRLWSRR